MAEDGLLGGTAVQALAPLVGVGLRYGRDADAEILLDALRGVPAIVTEVRFYDAWVAMRREDFAAAAAIFRALCDEGAGAKLPFCRALLCAALYALEDPSWRGVAEALIDEDTHPLAVRLARQLLGHAPLPSAGDAWPEKGAASRSAAAAAPVSGEAAARGTGIAAALDDCFTPAARAELAALERPPMAAWRDSRNALGALDRAARLLDDARTSDVLPQQASGLVRLHGALLAASRIVERAAQFGTSPYLAMKGDRS